MTRKQKNRLLLLGWILFFLLLSFIAATKGFALSVRHQQQRKVRVVVDDLYAKYLYVHGDLVSIYIDHSQMEDDTVVMVEDATKVFDLRPVTLCGGEYTEHRLKPLVGKTVLIAYDPQIANAANKCHELVGILPAQQGQ